ncbi:MAG TPA: HK97 family phage prohead protease [Nocardioides sp.]|nr:HK97 family phage prohead protease [Nocardioides sp.]
MTIERRTLVEPIEFRAEGGKLVAHGYAYVFNKLSKNLGGFVERIAPGAGKKTIQEQDVVALFNHDPNFVLGRMSSGTLRMEETDTGGEYEIDLPDTTAGRDAAHLLERGDLAGSSMGFRTLDDEWGETEQGYPLRTVKTFSLRDVGPVTFPAYSDTTAAMRSLAEARSLDIDLLVSAAKAGTLGALLTDGEHRDQEMQDDGRETPTVIRPRIAWAYA